MKLNLGCGTDIKQGYINVDFNSSNKNVLNVDLTKFPLPWDDDTVSEILMLDILEHIPYKNIDNVLQEVWRILKKDAYVDIQVPDFDHCARVVLGIGSFMCNECGYKFTESEDKSSCKKCGTIKQKMVNSALKRLYGGQNVIGNWHYFAFTEDILMDKLFQHGFNNFEQLEADHQYINWNFKLRAYKCDLWS